MMRRNGRSQHPRAREHAFSLLEVMFSLCIFALTAGTMTSGFLRQLKFDTDSMRLTEAAAAAQQVLDSLRLTDPATMPSSGTSAAQSITVGNRTYSVTTTYCPVTTYCTSSSVRHLRITVTYKSTTMYTVDTIYAQLR